MFKKTIIICATILASAPTLVTVINAAQERDGRDHTNKVRGLDQWMIVIGNQRDASGRVADRLYFGLEVKLFNLVERQYVAYGERDYGINLKWYKEPPASSFVVTRYRRSDRELMEPIKYGENVAIMETTQKKYLRYQEREYGINLVWDAKPFYEWQIFGGQAGTTIVKRPGGRGLAEPVVSLSNVRKNSFLVYGGRDYGINLIWSNTDVRQFYKSEPM